MSFLVVWGAGLCRIEIRGKGGRRSQETGANLLKADRPETWFSFEF